MADLRAGIIRLQSKAIRRFDESGSNADRPRSGRSITARTAENIQKIEDKGKPNKYQSPGTDAMEVFVGFCNNGYPTFSVFDTPPDQYIRFAYVAKDMCYIDHKNDVYNGLISWMLDSKICFTNCTVAFYILTHDVNDFLVPYMEVFEHCSKIEFRWNITSKKEMSSKLIDSAKAKRKKRPPWPRSREAARQRRSSRWTKRSSRNG
uniref:Uncharacterized protein n=1 Tax=Ditylenchus dipsaci TaxID=166011 RepID=A0A915D4E4_9BILA